MITKRLWTPLDASIVPHHVQTKARRLNENDALLLCDLFLTPGIHYIVFDSIQRGRKLVDSLAHIGSFYRAIAYIAPPTHEPLCGINLFELFKNNGDPTHALRHFLLYEFDYDFVWISYSQQQKINNFTRVFIESAVEFNLDSKIPFLCIFKNEL